MAQSQSFSSHRDLIKRTVLHSKQFAWMLVLVPGDLDEKYHWAPPYLGKVSFFLLILLYFLNSSLSFL